MHAAPKAASAWPSEFEQAPGRLPLALLTVGSAQLNCACPNMQRLKNRAQFQAVLAGVAIAKSGHFVLHRLSLSALKAKQSNQQVQTQEPIPAVTNPCAATVDKSAPVAMAHPSPLFETSGDWLGAMVPKRWAKRAVTRNMIKRRIYSLAKTASRSDAPVKDDAAYVVRLRSAFDPRLFKSATSAPLRLAVSQELNRLFAQGFRYD